MDVSLIEQQERWREDNKRSDPASEGELLTLESALGQVSSRRRQRVLGMFHASIDGRQGPVPDGLLRSQSFAGLTLVGAVSTLHGQEGLHSQCLWYSFDEFDWFWATITDVESIEVRADTRFRGGAECVWLTTPVAEYAMTTAHATYVNDWEDVLEFFNLPRCDVWPRTGLRPHWWPRQSAGCWPGEVDEDLKENKLSRETELRLLTEGLASQPLAQGTPWKRLGPKGDQRFPGQPLHNLGQLLEWDLAYNSGWKITRPEAQVLPKRKQDAARPGGKEAGPGTGATLLIVRPQDDIPREPEQDPRGGDSGKTEEDRREGNGGRDGADGEGSENWSDQEWCPDDTSDSDDALEDPRRKRKVGAGPARRKKLKLGEESAE
ncbi:hypothetical protein FRC12_012983 [Ceratobasidium sp. 428]|nr:hypothetical protein FRC12_012983 [Ceratobasidium sp. 428]